MKPIVSDNPIPSLGLSPEEAKLLAVSRPAAVSPMAVLRNARSFDSSGARSSGRG
jgi:hypothetical protein